VVPPNNGVLKSVHTTKGIGKGLVANLDNCGSESFINLMWVLIAMA